WRVSGEAWKEVREGYDGQRVCRRCRRGMPAPAASRRVTADTNRYSGEFASGVGGVAPAAFPRVQRAAGDDVIALCEIRGAVIGQRRERAVKWSEIRFRRLEQLVEAADHEIGLLEGVDAVARAHDPREIEADAVGRGGFEAEDALAFRREDARAVDAQALRRLDQAEFHRVPVEPRQAMQRVQL